MKPNQLIHEKSPYLQQHAHNPVDWHPWGHSAFELARKENKPLFVSIGYATCHWCHVMERESFENEEAAAALNQAFICIKVDREERPDIDAVYMTACNLLTGRGGWPLSVFLTPDRRPFFAATYIPPNSRFGQPGVIDLSQQLMRMWREEPQKILGVATELTGYLRNAFRFSASALEPSDETPFRNAAAWLQQQYDPQNGGFEPAPKFPTPHRLSFLANWTAHTKDPAWAAMAERTLLSMRAGGIWDHIGYGFHRYSTDSEWLLPHFEKMLYDQALISMAAMDIYEITKNPELIRLIEDIFTYVQRDLQSPEGAFFSAEDADSEGEEGRFYVWSKKELHQAIPKEFETWSRILDIQPDGNFRDEATKKPSGVNIIRLQQPLARWAQILHLDETALKNEWESIRNRLFKIRSGRIRPLLDDKILTDWNGLMIASFARAGRILNRAEYHQTAATASAWFLKHMRDPDGKLFHRYRLGESGVVAHAEDYAFLIHGLLELYQADPEPCRLAEVIRLQKILDAEFNDPTEGGYFTSSITEKDLPVRPREVYDGALPSANSMILSNLFKLAEITGDPEWKQSALRQAESFLGTIRKQPWAFTCFLHGLIRLQSLSASLK
jgi:uncharacterized protein YyaL (SSP411 family)